MDFPIKMVIFHSYVSLPEGILPGAFLSRSPILSVAPWHGPWVMLLAPWSLGQFCCLQSQWGFHEISMALSTPCQTSPVAFWWFLHVSAPSQATRGSLFQISLILPACFRMNIVLYTPRKSNHPKE